MFFGSRVEPEWRVLALASVAARRAEGESHSLTDALSFWFLPCAAKLLYSGGLTIGEHNGTF